MMETPKESDRFLKNSALYQEFLAEREEILRHKWIESQKAGYDIGFERALLDWISTHHPGWRGTRPSLPIVPLPEEGKQASP
jgi:hypothetical protein